MALDSTFFTSISEAYAELGFNLDHNYADKLVSDDPQQKQSPQAHNFKFSTIKAAYRKLCLERHPDKLSGNTESFQRLQGAWEIVQEEELKRLATGIQQGPSESESHIKQPDYQQQQGSGPASGPGSSDDDPQFYFRQQSQYKKNLNQNYSYKQNLNRVNKKRTNKGGNVIEQNNSDSDQDLDQDCEKNFNKSELKFRRLPKETLLSDYAASFGIKEKLCDWLSEVQELIQSQSSDSYQKQSSDSNQYSYYQSLSQSEKNDLLKLKFPHTFTNLDRKYVHQLAEALGLRSESEGDKHSGKRIVMVEYSLDDNIEKKMTKREMNRLVCEKGCDLRLLKGPQDLLPQQDGITGCTEQTNHNVQKVTDLNHIKVENFEEQTEVQIKSKNNLNENQIDNHIISLQTVQTESQSLSIDENVTAAIQTNNRSIPCPICGIPLKRFKDIERAKGKAGGFYERQDSGQDQDEKAQDNDRQNLKDENFDTSVDDFGRKRRKIQIDTDSNTVKDEVTVSQPVIIDKEEKKLTRAEKARLRKQGVSPK